MIGQSQPGICLRDNAHRRIERFQNHGAAVLGGC
jgi:hypothetical protein